MSHTSDTLERSENQVVEHFDVLIVGAGISGVGAGYHLQDQYPEKSFVILEKFDNFGGTWLTHTYPGVRSDSDLYTFGYRFKPWLGKPIATAAAVAPEDVSGVLQARGGLHAGLAWDAGLPGPDRASPDVAQRHRPRWQAGRRDRLRGHGGDPGAGDRRRLRTRHDAAAFADLFRLASERQRSG